MALEEVVFLAAAALGALQAADEEQRHADRDQNCENGSIYRNPMCQVLHLRSPFLGNAPFTHNEFTCTTL